MTELSTDSTVTWLAATVRAVRATTILASASVVRARSRGPTDVRSDAGRDLRLSRRVGQCERDDSIQGRCDVQVVLQVALLQRPRRAEPDGQASASAKDPSRRRSAPGTRAQTFAGSLTLARRGASFCACQLSRTLGPAVARCRDSAVVISTLSTGGSHSTRRARR